MKGDVVWIGAAVPREVKERIMALVEQGSCRSVSEFIRRAVESELSRLERMQPEELKRFLEELGY